MPKTTSFTTFTPCPAGITRSSVMDMLHDHMAMIDLNPLVIERASCKTPNSAPPDERDSKWYTIKDKVPYLPGGLAAGSLSYNACFRSLADGVQTHIYAPLGLDIEAKWTLGGHLPSEPRPPPLEAGLDPPKNGLYIREDVKMKCSSLLMSFVKRTFKESHARFLDTLVERAHILESNFANERLKALRNVDPGERMGHGDIFIAPPPDYVLNTRSPGFPHHTRSHSDPVLSPGFSQSSTIVDQSDDSRSPRPTLERSMTLDIMTDIRLSPLSPQSSSFLLPATTFDGGFSQRHMRPMTLYPGSFLSDQAISQLPSSPPSVPLKNGQLPSPPPKIGTPKSASRPIEQPVAFTFPFSPKSPFNPRSPFDKRSTSESRISTRKNLLDDIDDAIDEVFMFTLDSKKLSIVDAKKLSVLPATTYEPIQLLPSTTYSPKRESPKRESPRRESPRRESPRRESPRRESPRRESPRRESPRRESPRRESPKNERKDSMQVLPSTKYSKSSVPPVPAKDEKYLRVAVVAS